VTVSQHIANNGAERGSGRVLSADQSASMQRRTERSVLTTGVPDHFVTVTATKGRTPQCRIPHQLGDRGET
jgi:hypothetical protein